MDAREDLVSIDFPREDAEALAAAARVGLAVDVAYGVIKAPATGERAIAEMENALARRGKTVTATMSRVEAKVLEAIGESGVKVGGAVELAEEIDSDAALRAIGALRRTL